MVLAFSSAVSNLSNKTLIIIFYDFQGSTIKFHDFPGLENEIFKFHDFPGFPWPLYINPVFGLLVCEHCNHMEKIKYAQIPFASPWDFHLYNLTIS